MINNKIVLVVTHQKAVLQILRFLRTVLQLANMTIAKMFPIHVLKTN